MTEQYHGGVPDDFDAFNSAPRVSGAWSGAVPGSASDGDAGAEQMGLDRTMMFSAVPAFSELGSAPGIEPVPSGLKQRIARLGKAKVAVVGVVAAAVIGGGAWAGTSAFASSSTPSASGQPAAGADGPTSSATTAKNGAHAGKDAKAMKLAVTSVGSGTFTGTDAKGAVITVTYGDNTKFGNKVHPLTPDKLAVGMIVTVMGERTGDSVTATNIAEPVKGKKGDKPVEPGAGAPTVAAPSSSSTNS